MTEEGSSSSQVEERSSGGGEGNKDDSSSDATDLEEKRGVTRTVLLAVPLFCKFVIVLLIKFVTDLVVFPLLFLYRALRLAKRRLLKLLGMKTESDKEPSL